MRRWLRILAIGTAVIVVLIVALVGGFYLWAVDTRDGLLARVFDIPSHEFPIPFPLTEAETEALREEMRPTVPEGSDPLADMDLADPLADMDLDQLALERAVVRGKHLLEARYACSFCHGSDLGGGTMLDDPMIGTLMGPNLTTGEGSVTATYTAVDWDRKVRHGVNRTGHPGFMPSEDYVMMSDRELSDLVSYIRSQPAIDRVIPPVTLGPVGTFLTATGQIKFSVDIHPAHDVPHRVDPPPEGLTTEFGGHIAGVCTGCHRPEFNGGPIVGGPPDWPPAANLTSHEEGLKTWNYDDFVKAMRNGIRPDGVPIRPPMAEAIPLAHAMTDVEMQAIWMYFQSLPPLPDGT